jgi:hypothetical protein
MSAIGSISETAKAVVRRNTIEVQGGGNWEMFDELFADDFHDHTPQPGGKPDKAGVLELTKTPRVGVKAVVNVRYWLKTEVGSLSIRRPLSTKRTQATSVHLSTFDPKGTC